MTTALSFRGEFSQLSKNNLPHLNNSVILADVAAAMR
jgi:hypothetical protein